jgi:acetyltransferase-like isoleucine patch superfamily enzyme
LYDLGGLDISDDVMIGPNVSIITTGHPVEPSQRRAATIGKPIVIEKGVWIAVGAIIIGGVTVGEHSVVAAGSVVTKAVPTNSLVGGNPARIIRSIGDWARRHGKAPSIVAVFPIAVMMTSAEALSIRCGRNKAALANQEKRGAAPL